DFTNGTAAVTVTVCEASPRSRLKSTTCFWSTCRMMLSWSAALNPLPDRHRIGSRNQKGHIIRPVRIGLVLLAGAFGSFLDADSGVRDRGSGVIHHPPEDGSCGHLSARDCRFQKQAAHDQHVG